MCKMHGSGSYWTHGLAGRADSSKRKNKTGQRKKRRQAWGKFWSTEQEPLHPGTVCRVARENLSGFKCMLILLEVLLEKVLTPLIPSSRSFYPAFWFSHGTRVSSTYRSPKDSKAQAGDSNRSAGVVSSFCQPRWLSVGSLGTKYIKIDIYIWVYLVI